ncbi:MAG: DUF1592 domain-containing protein [Acidobacteria bacterium]|nr:DUF1592 domain-containing protein [Acidobacteriota bacterium]
MPPRGRPRPDQGVLDDVVEHLEASLDRAAAANPDPGRSAAFHRLSREQYQNAVRDLLTLEVDAAELLPADAPGYEFDNMAGVLTVSPALMERYMSAARKVSRLAVGLPQQPVVETYDVPLNLVQEDRLNEDFPLGSRGGAAFRHNFPVDGEYVIKVDLQTNYVDYIRGLNSPHQIEIRLDGRRVESFTVGGDVPEGGADAAASSAAHDNSSAPGPARGQMRFGAAGQRTQYRAPGAAPESYEGNILGSLEWEHYMQHADDGLQLRLPVRAGPHEVVVSFLRQLWEPDGVLQPRPYGFALAIDATPDGVPAVGSVAISGPYAQDGVGETPSRRAIFDCRPLRDADEQACAIRILTRLATAAYRRPARDRELQTLLDFYAAGREKGSFDEGIQLALERLLVDPNFLFRIERDPSRAAPGTPYDVSDLELASRLSFFLWSSVPDDELLAAAARGQLRNPGMLEQQVRRMLADSRATTLVDGFAGQWLQVRNIRTVYPDPGEFPHFDDNLREALLEETRLFIDSQIREDRGVPELLSADYTFLNERLARHYGVPNVYGSRFRRVPLNGGDRGGLLGHGSILTVTSYPNRTSPVLRGKWLLENILGTPPAPPPPEVPSLPERGEGGGHATVRERLEAHRNNPACAACHASIDPLGFTLERFDATGARRTLDEGAVIDASGTLPGGTTIEGLSGLRALLLDRREQFVRTVTEKLLTYALGRGIEHYDLPVVRGIVREAAANEYRWSAIIMGIVRSTPFQMRSTKS